MPPRSVVAPLEYASVVEALQHLLVHDDVFYPSSENTHSWDRLAHSIRAKILIASFPLCQQLVI